MKQSMFATLDQIRKQFITGRDRLFRWGGGVIFAIFLLTAVYLATVAL